MIKMNKTGKKEFCPYCEKINDVSLISKTETLPVLGETVEYEARVYRCNVCQREFAPTSLEKENFRVAYDIYRKRHNLLDPQKIKEIREMYGLSQRNFSLFLGWGEITIHRYESGAMQDKVHNEMLALLEDPKNAMTILELNRNDLPPDFVKVIEQRIEELLRKKSFDTCFTDCITSLLGKKSADAEQENILSGNKEFDMEKFENLVLYLLEQCQSIVKTKLNKLLWFCDFRNFKNNDISITGAKYVHLQYGPVPNNYDVLLWLLSVQNKITSREIIYDDFTGEEYYPNQSFNSSIFTSKELDNVNQVLSFFKKLTAKEISEISHREEGYRETRHLDFIPYSFAKKLSV